MEGGGRMSGLASQQDGGQFEDALRRLHALEIKLTDQVQVDITELRNKWVQPRVDRVTNNTFKLWQVRENLKLSKKLYCEEERLLGEFKKVKDALITAAMDDDYFEATKDTCIFLGAKLTEARNQQLLCYSSARDLETAVNKDIMTIRFEDKDFEDLDLEQVRASTPLREMEPTPLDRHRSKSREPSPFTMPPMRLTCGTTTPGGSSVADPHAYFSRPGSSQSLHGGRGGATDKKEQEFRSKMEAMHAGDDSPPTDRKLALPKDGMVCRSASGRIIKDDPVETAPPERPGSAMSDMSIQLPETRETSRPGSRMDHGPAMLGDDLSHSLLDLTQSGNHFSPSGRQYGVSPGKNMLDDLDVEINLGEDAATKREEEEEASRRAAEANTEKIRAEAKKQFEEKEKDRKEEEAAQKKVETAAKAEKIKQDREAEAKKLFEEKEKDRKEEEAAQKKVEMAAKAEKIKQEREAEAQEREDRKKTDEKKMADMAEKRRVAAEKQAEEELKKKQEVERKKDEEKQKKLEAKAKKEAEEKKKEDEKLAKEAEKQAKLDEKKRKVEETKEKKRLEEEKKLEDDNKTMLEALKAETLKAETLKADMQKEKQAEALKSQAAAEKKSLERDVTDLEAGLQQEKAPKRPTSRDGKKEPDPAAEEPAAPKRPTSRAGQKEPDPATEEPAAPKRPTSRAGGKEDAAPKLPASSAGKKDPEPAPKRPSSRAGQKDPETAAKSEVTKPGDQPASDADDEGEIIVEKPRSKSRSASRTRTASHGAVEEEESEKEEEPQKRSLSRGRPQADENKDSKGKPVSRTSSKVGAKEDPGTTEAKSKPVSRSNSKAGGTEETAVKKKEEAGAAFVKSVKARSSSRGRPEEAEPEVEDAPTLKIPSKPVSRSNSGILGSRKVSESERKISESETAPQAGSRQTSRGASPVGILKGGKRSRDASKDRATVEVSKGRDASRDRIAATEADEVIPGKPVSRSASLKKSISFSKKNESFDDYVEDKFNKAEEPLQSAKDIFAAIADTSLESGLMKSRSESKDRPGSRTSGSGFPQAEPREMPMDMDDEDELMIILDDAEMPGEPELELLTSRSQSRERPGSRGSQSSQASSRPGVLKSRSASNVPELEAVEVPDSLKSMIEGLRRMEEAGEDELDATRPRSGAARQPKEEFPRPLSQQARPASSAGSTGFSHLDEFERKLAEMENELDHEAKDTRPGSAMRRGATEWNLSPETARMARDSGNFQEVAQDFKDTFAMNITKLAQAKSEAIYATVQKNKKGATVRTDDGFYINQEEELGGVDHSMIQGGEYMMEEDAGSEYVFDEITGQSIRRSKKVSFAASEERFLIQRETQLSGLGRMKEMLTLSAPKPMKSLPGKEPKEDDRPGSRSSRRSGSRSKEPSPSPANFLHAMTGGLMGNQEPGTLRREGSNSSLFGSLLRRGRKGSRSGSQQGSRDSSGDRSSDVGGEFEDGRGSSLASDAGSEGSIVMKIKNLRKKKPKVQPQDFDQLFARGLALSAQLESEQNKDPFGPKAVDLGRQMMEVGAATAAAGGDTEAISVALNEGVSGVTGVRMAGVGYQEKVNAYLDDQTATPGAPVSMGEEPRERGRRRHRKEPKKAGAVPAEVAAAARSASDEKRKTSREYTKPEDIQLSPRPRRDLFTGEMLAPGSPDALFLAKVTAFVASQEEDINVRASGHLLVGSQPGKPTTPLPPIPTDLLGPLMPPPAPRLAPSPGKAFLDSKTGFDVFGPSIEHHDNPPAAESQDGAMANETPYAPTTLTMNKFAAAAKDAAIKLTSPPPTSTAAHQIRGASSMLPGPDEPGDKGIPAQLMPDKLMANEEFYEKLRSGLKNALTPERAFEGTQEEPPYQKYSHHLGRAEFGTLKKPSAATSRDTSGERLNQRMLSRNTSTDKINEKPGSRKVSRQSSGARDFRSDSRASDYSIALPDLEVDPNAELERDVVGAPVMRTMSDNINDPLPTPRPNVASQDVLHRKEEVLKDMELHRQKIQEAKAWIQNGLMTVVGVGVMAYLQTLEQMGGAT